jgi:penicillin amidase
MTKVFRWLVRIFLGLCVLGAAGIGLVYYLASRSLPDYDAHHAAAGLHAPLEIVRDNADIPHIFGKSDEDSFFGLGYVHAQDRLWQMLMLRRTVQGRLSEVFGARTLPIDKLMRRLDLYGLATASVKAQDDYGRAALEAYSRGVNARIARVNDAALGRGAPELFLFPMNISPWTPADSIAIGKLMALELSTHVADEVRRARASLILSPERLKDLMPDVPGPGIAALPKYAMLVPGVAPDTSAPDEKLRQALAPVLSGPDMGGASNAWAAAPSRAAKRGSLLASDPHLHLTAPSIMYLARLKLASGDVIGATIPGLPLVLIGRSAKLAWGLTSSYLDDQDVYVEKVNPDNPAQYETPTGWKDFVTRQSIIQVKGKPPVTITLKWTDNGPVLPDGTWGLDRITPAGDVPTIAWTALSGRDTSVSAFLKIMESGSVHEAIQNGEGVIAPSNNLILADKDGVGMVMLGGIPRRSIHHQSQGRLPTQGWLPENRWQGVMGYAANPKFEGPEIGIVGNTNNKIVDRPFPFNISFSWGDTERIRRWKQLMESRKVHTRESFIEAQLDTVSITARTLLPLVGKDLFFTGESAPSNTLEGRRKQALDMLAAWNGDMNEHMPEPLIYMAWMRFLQKRLIQDDLGGLADDFQAVDPLFIERVFRNVDGASAWCDIKNSAKVETCDDIAKLSLDDALEWIKTKYGSNLASLRWGDAHETRADHQVLGGIPGLGWLVNIRQSTSGGPNTLMRGNTIDEGPDPFLNVHASVMRMVVDFSDPDSSLFVTSTGQSGHPLSRYYDDMAALWRRGEYVPMALNPDLARAAAVGITHLTPK